ncbi:MAG: SRPBCC domain-containing protein, partial [Betaproteobacteria bacterium]
MPASAPVTWNVLSDIAAVATCMPGAAITEKIDDTHYKGTVRVKLGPANLSFRGEIEVLQLDATIRTLHLAAKGTDTTGSSFAEMDLSARVETTPDGLSALVGTSEASVGGKAAAFGNRMMDAVSDQILKQ